MASTFETPQVPTPVDDLWFRMRASVLQLKRVWSDRFRVRRFTPDKRLQRLPVVVELHQPLRSYDRPSERWLQNGKIQNLRLAVRAIDGVELEPGDLFSFWRQVGRPVRSRGFVDGREIREGCVIVSVGGGLCQLSNLLYQAAVASGCEIVERHHHSMRLPDSAAEEGRDATVFWNYIDLRFRAKQALRIEAMLTRSDLVIRFRGDGEPGVVRIASASRGGESVHDCITCGQVDCYRHVERRMPESSRQAFLLDERWPEFADHVSSLVRDADQVCLPISDENRPRYAWQIPFGAQVDQQRWIALRRSFASRRLSEEGAERQRAMLRYDELLARAFAAQLEPDVEQLTVMLSLLPFLWKEGVLGGRIFDVLANRLPLHMVHRQLDRAAELHPESSTLRNFRADPDLIAAEEEALGAARGVVTPHRLVAAELGEKALVVDWVLPPAGSVKRGKEVVLAGSALGRKGAFELRAAARELGFPVRVVGEATEDRSFWNGIDLRPLQTGWLDEAAVVVLPAFVESQPRRLLRALACGVPVIASPACGLGELKGVVTVPEGDVDALGTAIRNFL